MLMSFFQVELKKIEHELEDRDEQLEASRAVSK